MTRWQLETSARFDKAARKLDRQVLRRIKTYLDEVCELEDPRSRGKGLTGDLAGYWRYRVGDYRVILEIRARPSGTGLTTWTREFHAN